MAKEGCSGAQFPRMAQRSGCLVSFRGGAGVAFGGVEGVAVFDQLVYIRKLSSL